MANGECLLRESWLVVTVRLQNSRISQGLPHVSHTEADALATRQRRLILA